MNHCRRILRSYRIMPPTRFHALNQMVKISLLDKTRFPASFWVGHEELFESYISTSEKFDGVYHESMIGSKLVIAEREVLQAQLVLYLDEIAAILEMAAFHNPDILLASGFELSKERRGHPRAKTEAATRNAAATGQEES